MCMIDKIIFLVDKLVVKINLKLNIINLLSAINIFLNYKINNYFKIKIKLLLLIIIILFYKFIFIIVIIIILLLLFLLL